MTLARELLAAIAFFLAAFVSGCASNEVVRMSDDHFGSLAVGWAGQPSTLKLQEADRKCRIILISAYAPDRFDNALGRPIDKVGLIAFFRSASDQCQAEIEVVIMGYVADAPIASVATDLTTVMAAAKAAGIKMERIRVLVAIPGGH